MPETVTVLRVFVASPGDVASERNSLVEIIEEINLTWGKHLGIHLELVKWETHAYPGVGSDAQDVINNEIGDDYDIFIGILWTRFGTPTKRADSGTAEEFERAYEKSLANPDQLRIMFYFSQAPTSPGEINPDQLILINKFRDQLGEQGVLWWPYRKRKEFASLLRMHLSRQIQEWRKSWGVERVNLTQGVELEAPYTQESDAIIQARQPPDKGFFELVELGRIHIGSFIETTKIILNEVQVMNVVMDAWGQAASRLQEHTNALEIAEHFKQLGYLGADEMARFITKVESQIPVFSETYGAAIDSFAQAALRLPEVMEVDRTRIDEAITAILDAKGTLQQLSNIFNSCSIAIGKWPPVIPAFDFIKIHAVSTIGIFAQELNNAANLTTEAEKLLRQKYE